MTITTYEHAGNSDQLRDLQFNAAARCELCHYPAGYESPGKALTQLEMVKLPNGSPALMCTGCKEVCRDLGDADYSIAVSAFRPLLPETQTANEALLAELLVTAVEL